MLAGRAQAGEEHFDRGDPSWLRERRWWWSHCKKYFQFDERGTEKTNDTCVQNKETQLFSLDAIGVCYCRHR